MNKNIFLGLIIILIILCIVEGYLVVKERREKMTLGMQLASLQQKSMKPTPPTGKRLAPMMVLKGQKFTDNPLFSKAYLIFPANGPLSADAMTALTGWDMKTAANSDGSTRVDLVPKESEDIKQSFTVKPGYKLYFIEMTLVDDKNGIDENRGDDIGVLVDPNGIVQ